MQDNLSIQKRGRHRNIMLRLSCETVGIDEPMKRQIMAKKEELDPETLAVINWCIEVEGFLIAGGATMTEAQNHIEEQIEWFTDLFYDGLTPEEAAKEALA